jgi:hypothetical protein
VAESGVERMCSNGNTCFSRQWITCGVGSIQEYAVNSVGERTLNIEGGNVVKECQQRIRQRRSTNVLRSSVYESCSVCRCEVWWFSRCGTASDVRRTAEQNGESCYV